MSEVTSERRRGTDVGGESLTHTRWSGGRGYLRRGKWIRDEKCVIGRDESMFSNQ